MTVTTPTLYAKQLAGSMSPSEADQAAFVASLQTNVPEKVDFLLNAVGPRYTAAAIGLNDARPLRRWSEGSNIKETAVKERLALLFRLVYAITALYDQDTAGLFLHSAHPKLGDQAPLMVLRNGEAQDVQPELLAAARALLYG